MRGTVIHANGRFRRSLENLKNRGQLTVKAVTSLAPIGAGKPGTQLRPLYYAFYHDGKSFAGSPRVMLVKGRRYPNVEHWFIYYE